MSRTKKTDTEIDTEVDPTEELTEVLNEPKVELEVEEAPVITKSGRPYRVFNSRADLIAQVNSLEEAEGELSRFPGGFYRMI